MMPIKIVIDHLEQLNVLHRKLLSMGEQKREVLIANQVNEFAVFVNQESKLLKQVAETEAAWRAAIIQFVEANGLKPTPSFTVTEIMKLVFNAEDRQALSDAHQALMETITLLKDMNAVNQQLIEQSLSFINYSLDLYMGDSGQDVVYRNPAQAGSTQSGKRRVFDTRG